MIPEIRTEQFTPEDLFSWHVETEDAYILAAQ